jgi:glutamine synthetase
LFLIFCECYNPDGTPAIGNTRHTAKLQFDKYTSSKIWFGIEQEFFMFDKKTKLPVTWDIENPLQQGTFYCGIGSSNKIERNIMDIFIEKCLYSGVEISGTNQEVAPSQWEYQIGPLEGIESADQMHIARFILESICEQYDIYIDYSPKPLLQYQKENDISTHWNGSGAHVNISTNQTREQEKGYDEIIRIIKNMEKDHTNFINYFSGKDNHLRLTGDCETSNPNIFSYSVGSRDTSVRIPNNVYQDKCGYFEDRRPGSSIDYYITTSKYLEYLD